MARQGSRIPSHLSTKRFSRFDGPLQQKTWQKDWLPLALIL
jgi:hypothetical protein